MITSSLYLYSGPVKRNTMNRCCQSEGVLPLAATAGLKTDIKLLSLSRADSCQTHLSQSMNPMWSVRTQDKIMTSFSPP